MPMGKEVRKIMYDFDRSIVGVGPIPGDAILVFDIELLEIKKGWFS